MLTALEAHFKVVSRVHEQELARIIAYYHRPFLFAIRPVITHMMLIKTRVSFVPHSLW